MRERDFSHYTAFSSKRLDHSLKKRRRREKKVSQKIKINLETNPYQQGTMHHQKPILLFFGVSVISVQQ